MWAASELSKFTGNSRVVEALTGCLRDDPFWSVRKSAVEALGKLNVKSAVNLLKKSCKDKNSRVRTSILRVLGDRGDSNLLSFLKTVSRKKIVI